MTCSPWMTGFNLAHFSLLSGAAPGSGHTASLLIPSGAPLWGRCRCPVGQLLRPISSPAAGGWDCGSAPLPAVGQVSSWLCWGAGGALLTSREGGRSQVTDLLAGGGCAARTPRRSLGGGLPHPLFSLEDGGWSGFPGKRERWAPL